MKKVTTIIRRSPFNSVVTSEALRMSLGLTLANNKVAVIFIGNGVYLLVTSGSQEAVYPEMKRHIETLRELGCELIAETESLEERGFSAGQIDVKKMSRVEIGQFLMESDRVIGF